MQGIDLLTKCLDGMKLTKNTEKQPSILCQLGKHQWHESKKLTQRGKKIEADKLFKKAEKVSFCIIDFFNVLLISMKLPANKANYNFLLKLKHFVLMHQTLCDWSEPA